jgi:hypothetical protein
MSTTTATIFIGHADPNDSGIHPTHFIQFTENDAPALILRDIEGKEKIKVIIPTIENTIDDIFLMIAVFILKQVRPSKEIHNFERKNLYELFEQNERLSLYGQTLKLFETNNIKVIINIFDTSHLLTLIDQVKKYSNDIEVTLTYLKKEYNVWSNKIEKTGF